MYMQYLHLLIQRNFREIINYFMRVWLANCIGPPTLSPQRHLLPHVGRNGRIVVLIWKSCTDKSNTRIYNGRPWHPWCYNIIQIASLKLLNFPGLPVWIVLCPFLSIISQFPLTFLSPFSPSSEDKPLAVVLIQLDFENRLIQHNWTFTLGLGVWF